MESLGRHEDASSDRDGALRRLKSGQEIRNIRKPFEARPQRRPFLEGPVNGVVDRSACQSTQHVWGGIPIFGGALQPVADAVNGRIVGGVGAGYLEAMLEVWKWPIPHRA